MSVRIIRKEETRNTTVWQFLGVAILPLLVAYFGGFSAGKTLKVDTDITQSQVEAMQNHIKLLQDSLQAQSQLLANLDSIQKPIQDKVFDFGSEIKQAFADAGEGNTDGAGDDVMQKVEDYFDEIRDWMDEKESVLKKNDLYTPTSKLSFSLFEKIIELQKNRLKDRQTISGNKVDDGALSKCEEEKSALTEEIASLKLDLKGKDIDMKGKDSKQDNANQSNQKALESLKESKTLSESISNEVNIIRTSILPKLKTGLIGNKQQIAQLKGEIDGHISIISDKANEIKALTQVK